MELVAVMVFVFVVKALAWTGSVKLNTSLTGEPPLIEYNTPTWSLLVIRLSSSVPGSQATVGAATSMANFTV